MTELFITLLLVFLCVCLLVFIIAFISCYMEEKRILRYSFNKNGRSYNAFYFFLVCLFCIVTLFVIHSLFVFSLSIYFLLHSQTSGVVNNTGRGLSFFPRETNITYISRGPLSYRYRLTEIRLHFGVQDTEGSEHTVGGRAFPGEVSWKILHFNTIFF